MGSITLIYTKDFPVKPIFGILASYAKRNMWVEVNIGYYKCSLMKYFDASRTEVCHMLRTRLSINTVSDICNPTFHELVSITRKLALLDCNELWLFGDPNDTILTIAKQNTWIPIVKEYVIDSNNLIRRVK